MIMLAEATDGEHKDMAVGGGKVEEEGESAALFPEVLKTAYSTCMAVRQRQIRGCEGDLAAIAHDAAQVVERLVDRLGVEAVEPWRRSGLCLFLRLCPRDLQPSAAQLEEIKEDTGETSAVVESLSRSVQGGVVGEEKRDDGAGLEGEEKVGEMVLRDLMPFWAALLAYGKVNPHVLWLPLCINTLSRLCSVTVTPAVAKELLASLLNRIARTPDQTDLVNSIVEDGFSRMREECGAGEGKKDVEKMLW